MKPLNQTSLKFTLSSCYERQYTSWWFASGFLLQPRASNWSFLYHLWRRHHTSPSKMLSNSLTSFLPQETSFLKTLEQQSLLGLLSSHCLPCSFPIPPWAHQPNLFFSISARALWPYLHSLPRTASGTSVYEAHDKYLLISQKPWSVWNPVGYLNDQTISFC